MSLCLTSVSSSSMVSRSVAWPRFASTTPRQVNDALLQAQSLTPIKRQPPPFDLHPKAILRPTVNHLWESGRTYNPSVLITQEPGQPKTYTMIYRAEDRSFFKIDWANHFWNYNPWTAMLRTVKDLVRRYDIERKIPGLKYAWPRWYKNLDYRPLAPSIIAVATSTDGLNFTDRRPLIVPTAEHWARFPNGFQDARIARLGDTYYVLCTANNPGEKNRFAPRSERIKGSYIYLFTSKDLKTFEDHGIIGPDVYDKNAVLLPERVIRGNRSMQMMFHRMFPNIQYVLTPDIRQLGDNETRQEFWSDHLDATQLESHTVLKPTFDWEDQIGACSTPIKTLQGWLLIYHAADKRKRYRVGAALLDLNEPWRVVARSPKPLFEDPSSTVIFPSGAVLDDNRLKIYYGSNDQTVRMASCDASRLLDYLVQHNDKGIPKNSSLTA